MDPRTGVMYHSDYVSPRIVNADDIDAYECNTVEKPTHIYDSPYVETTTEQGYAVVEKHTSNDNGSLECSTDDV